jgi:hypothetical protein
MLDTTGRQTQTYNIRRTTAALERVAARQGDYFLQYLYLMALHHLDDRIGVRDRRRPHLPPFEGDAVVKRMAKRLAAHAKANGR